MRGQFLPEGTRIIISHYTRRYSSFTINHQPLWTIITRPVLIIINFYSPLSLIIGYHQLSVQFLHVHSLSTTIMNQPFNHVTKPQPIHHHPRHTMGLPTGLLWRRWPPQPLWSWRMPTVWYPMLASWTRRHRDSGQGVKGWWRVVRDGDHGGWWLVKGWWMVGWFGLGLATMVRLRVGVGQGKWGNTYEPMAKSMVSHWFMAETDGLVANGWWINGLLTANIG